MLKYLKGCLLPTGRFKPAGVALFDSCFVVHVKLLFSFMLVCLFDLWFSVPINSNGHIGTLLPLYVISTQHYDLITSKIYLKI